jgi:signal transduction histidine kinase
MGLTDEGNPTEAEADRFGSNVLPASDARSMGADELWQALTHERRRSEQLATALRESQESVRRTDDLISMVSHDLRTPLSSIQLNVQSILHSRRLLPRWVRGRLLRVEELVRHSAQLISDVLTIERFDPRRGPFKTAAANGADDGRPGDDRGALEATDLHAFVRETVSLLHEQIAAAKCSVRIQCDGALAGTWDRVYLGQIVSNLVTNAVKYGAGKPFEITLCRRAEGVRMVISDHGIGVAEQDQERIFERFQQLRPTNAQSGVGLGLWIVAEAAHRLNGSIRVRSIPGEGSAFIVDLPGA